MRLAEGDHREAVRRSAGPGPEVAVLVVAGRHRDVQLARPRDQLTAGRDEDRGVVAEPVAAVGALVQRGVDVDAVSAAGARRSDGWARRAAPRARRPRPAARPVDREVAAERQLLQADELRALARRRARSRRRARPRAPRVGMPALLHGPNPEARTYRRSLSRNERGASRPRRTRVAMQGTLGALPRHLRYPPERPSRGAKPGSACKLALKHATPPDHRPRQPFAVNCPRRGLPESRTLFASFAGFRTDRASLQSIDHLGISSTPSLRD